MASWQPDDVLLSDSDDDEYAALQMNYRGRSAILFVIDGTMYADRDLFAETLKIIRKAFVAGILVNNKDLLGVVFANTKHSPDALEMHGLEKVSIAGNCAVFLPLRQLTVEIVQYMCEFVDSRGAEYGRQYGIAGPNEQCSFAALISMCINMFDHCGLTLIRSDIVYLTTKESPHVRDSHEYQRALQKATDLEGKEISFHVIPMVDDFDYEKFYKEFLVLSSDGDMEGFVTPIPQQERELLVERKLRQQTHRRCLGHFNFSLGANVDVSVKYYNYFQLHYFPKKVQLLRKDKSIVERKYKIVVTEQDPDTMEFTQEEEVKVSDGWYEINLGQQTIKVSNAQWNRVRNLHKPGMMLLGFKPLESLPLYMHYKPCQFMYPDDESIVGSKRLFVALWQRCLDRKKIAICLFMCKRKSKPRYVALVPVQYDPTATLSADGFKIVFLPCSKHIRRNDFSDWWSEENEPSSEAVAVFEKVVRKLRIEYEPTQINDPKLENLQAQLLAQADISDPDALSSMPDPRDQDERIAKLLPQFAELFGPDVEPAAKRTAARSVKNADGEPAAKQVKINEDDLKDLAYVREMITSDRLNSCTVAQLRFILEQHFDVRMPKVAKKGELIDRVKDLNT